MNTPHLGFLAEKPRGQRIIIGFYNVLVELHTALLTWWLYPLASHHAIWISWMCLMQHV